MHYSFTKKIGALKDWTLLFFLNWGNKINFQKMIFFLFHLSSTLAWVCSLMLNTLCWKLHQQLFCFWLALSLLSWGYLVF